MTCKDCYHYEKCYFEALQTAHLTGRDYREIVCIDNQISCKFFKDKSLIVELPCNVRDEIYYITIKRYAPLSYQIKRAIVTDFYINKNNIVSIELKTKSNFLFALSIDKVYLDKSKAEKS